MKKPGYDFTCDFVTSHEKVWNECLTRFKGHPCKALEVGSHEGRSAIWFLENILDHPSSRLTCIDPWAWNPDYERRFKSNIEASGLSEKCLALKGYSANILPSLTQKVDFAYIDGAKDADQFLMNAVLVWLNLTKGGLILFDDYGWTFKENKDLHRKPPQVGIDAFLDAYEGLYEVIHKGWQVVIQKL